MFNLLSHILNASFLNLHMGTLYYNVCPWLAIPA